MSVRNIFTSDSVYSPDEMPRDMRLPVTNGRSWDEQYNWYWLPIAPQLPASQKAKALTEKAMQRSASADDENERPLQIEDEPRARPRTQKRAVAPRAMSPEPVDTDPLLHLSVINGYSGNWTKNLLWTRVPSTDGTSPQTFLVYAVNNIVVATAVCAIASSVHLDYDITPCKTANGGGGSKVRPTRCYGLVNRCVSFLTGLTIQSQQQADALKIFVIFTT
jgi:hypothetical protein